MLVAILFSQSRLIEFAFYPFAIILQVTPVVAIAPLLLIWIGYDNITVVLVVLAWIISFFSILSNMVVGLRSADHNLVDLFRLYGASRWQIFWRLQLPGALPYLLSGMKVSGGLALIGAVTAELVAGSGNDTGLGWIITLAGRNLETAKVFAALAMLSVLGIAIFFALTALEWAAPPPLARQRGEEAELATPSHRREANGRDTFGFVWDGPFSASGLASSFGNSCFTVPCSPSKDGRARIRSSSAWR